MKYIFLLVINIFISLCKSHDDDRVPLYIGGTFPMEAGSGGWAGGVACKPAVMMALHDVNKRRDVLPGYYLELNSTDSKCQPGLATQQLYDLLYTPPAKVMLLVGCSPVTTIIAEAAPVWNLIVLAYGASSPALSNRERFPTLFRTHPSANIQNPARVSILKKFGWKKITILQSVEEVFTSTAKDLEEECKLNGIKADRLSFYGDPTDAIKTLIRQDARIIVGLFYEKEARRVFCQAYHHRAFGRKHVWLLIGWYADTWYLPVPDEHLNCTAEQMREAALYHMTTESLMLSTDDSVAISGMTGREFQRRLNEVLETDPANTGGYPEAPLAYDAVWALALALNCTINHLPSTKKIEQFTYEDVSTYELLFQCMKNTSFRGVSGRVMFSNSGDRIAKVMVEQLQKDSKYHVMGFFDSSTHLLDWKGEDEWLSDKGPPADSTIIHETVLTVTSTLFYGVLMFCILGIGMSIALLSVIEHNSGRMIVKCSQPKFNNFTILGCIICWITLFFIGLPSEHIPVSHESFTAMCHFRIFTLMVGFSLGFGSMFAKVFIAHRMGADQNQQLANREKEEADGTPWESIRTLIASMIGRSAASLRKSSLHSEGEVRNNILNQTIPVNKFYAVLTAFIVCDIVICVVWVFFDPMVVDEQRYPLQEPPEGSDDDIMLLPKLEYCKSENEDVWTALILGYKCLLLIFGIFLSYECRNIKLHHMNDIRLIALSIYNVAILSIITAPISVYLIRNQPNASYAFISVTVLLCTYISLGLIFIPKIRHIYTVPPSEEEIQNGGNGVMKGLTKPEQRRFEQLVAENAQLQKQIEEREKRITQCAMRIELLRKRSSLQSQFNNNSFSINDNSPKCRKATTTTTTAYIELDNLRQIRGKYLINDKQYITNNGVFDSGDYMSIRDDVSSCSSDEIIL
ncbi:unnamed protein product [Auanema sp. JU1783]|nr:unnamed protein product [Auanema sp. JU1783]